MFPHRISLLEIRRVVDLSLQACFSVTLDDLKMLRCLVNVVHPSVILLELVFVSSAI